MSGRIRCLCLLLLLCLFLTGCGEQKQASAVTATLEPVKVTQVGYYFDTVVTITLYNPDESLMEDLMASCERYEKLLSKTIAGSDVDRINNSGGKPVTVSGETWLLLQDAKKVHEVSDGAFSVTIAPVTALWDFTGGTERMPSAEELAAALPLVDDSRLQMGENNTVTLPEGMMIDLGGIAKGYIADRAAALCRGRCTGAVINLGGNVYVTGEKPDGSAFRVGIRDPQGAENSTKCIVSVRDTSVVTSGVYERFFMKDGVRYHHILNPRTGFPAESDLAGATVVCTSSVLADAVATACIVLGSENAVKLLNTLDLDGLLITVNGNVITTEGFAEKYGVTMF